MQDWVWKLLGKLFAGLVMVSFLGCFIWAMLWYVPAQNRRVNATLQIQAIERRQDATNRYSAATAANDTTAMKMIQAEYIKWYDSLSQLAGQ